MKIKFMRSFEFTLDVALIGKIMQWAGMAGLASALICGATGAVDLMVAITVGVVAFPVVLFGCIIEAEGK